MTQYEKDIDNFINFNGKPMPIAYYNLAISIRDVSLFTKGIVAHRGWRLKHVKEYFGLKGNKEKILEQLKAEMAEWQKLTK